MLEASGDVVLAAEWRIKAEDTARMNRESRSYIATLLLMVGLGTIWGIAGLVIGSWGAPRGDRVAAVVRRYCTTGAAIVWGGLALAGVVYITAYVVSLVLIGDD